jgi:hypothetical protein
VVSMLSSCCPSGQARLSPSPGFLLSAPRVLRLGLEEQEEAGGGRVEPGAMAHTATEKQVTVGSTLHCQIAISHRGAG